MAEATQFDPEWLRLTVDNGEVVELDGGALVLGGEESPSVVLRLAPWRARSVARVLEEWSAVSRVFHRAPRPILTELELSRTLDLAASVLGEPEPTVPMQRGGQTVPSRQRLDAVAVLAKRGSSTRRTRDPALLAATSRPGRRSGLMAIRAQRRRPTGSCAPRSGMHHRGHRRACVPGTDHPTGKPGGSFQGPAFVVANPYGRPVAVKAHARA